ENLLFASHDGSVHSCTAYNKVQNWSFSATGPISAGLAVDESGVYVASEDRSLYRLDSFSGTVRWQRPLPMPLRDAPVVAGRTVYQYSQQTGLFAVDVDSGELRWHRPDARSFVARHADQVWVLANDRERLLALDDRTGELRGKLDIFAARAVAANPRDDAIYLVSGTNRAVCLRPADVPYLSFKELTEMRARLLKGREAADEAAALLPGKSGENSSRLDDPLRSRREITPVAGD
ncbi:MAG: outer membrane protein assembly factor BamB family protein, partial [Planctomycetota bacterium]